MQKQYEAKYRHFLVVFFFNELLLLVFQCIILYWISISWIRAINAVLNANRIIPWIFFKNLELVSYRTQNVYFVTLVQLVVMVTHDYLLILLNFKWRRMSTRTRQTMQTISIVQLFLCISLNANTIAQSTFWYVLSLGMNKFIMGLNEMKLLRWADGSETEMRRDEH